MKTSIIAERLDSHGSRFEDKSMHTWDYVLDATVKSVHINMKTGQSYVNFSEDNF